MESNQQQQLHFPTGETVPFPYARPYPVQTELMSAILSSLRQCRELNELSNSTTTNTTTNTTTTVVSGDDAGKDDDGGTRSIKRRAPIIMVESPTGTGKSLSLACASVAWLRYCQEMDLKIQEDAAAVDDVVQKEKNLDCATAVDTKKKRRDWLDSWQPDGSSLQCNDGRSADCSNENQVKTYAINNRAALNRELNSLRARLSKLSNVAAISQSGVGVNDNVNQQRALLRENLLKSGISRALALERKRSRLSKKGGCNKSSSCKSDKKRKVSTIEDEFLLDDYQSDQDEKKDDGSDDSEDDELLSNLNKSHATTANKQPIIQNLSTKALLCGANLDGSGYKTDPERNARSKSYNTAQQQSNITTPTVGQVKPGSGLQKIIYAARTHSQLSQFIGELKRTHWGKDVKVVALGSRSVLCSNENVLYYPSSSRENIRKQRRSEAEITELCLDMQKSKNERGVSSKCPLLESSEAVSTLALHSLVHPSDIEDMATLGKAGHACSYYASREAIAAAEVVVLPYNSLLSESARQSIGLSLKNALVVIDEAHNVPEALRGISSCQLSLSVIEAAMSQLAAYTAKYSCRLAGRNLSYLGQIRRVLLAMSKYLKKPPRLKGDENDGGDGASSSTKKEMLAAVDLMFRLKLDNLNLFTLLRYIQKSRISQKLLGFVNHAGINSKADSVDTEQVDAEQQNTFMSRHISALSIVETFLERLTCTSREGKVIIEWSGDSASNASGNAMFRFVQIHSASLLDGMVEEAHAIILAGGTLRPFSHVAAELFGQNDEVMKAASTGESETFKQYDNATLRPSSYVHITPQLTTFTCGHVIPSTNVITSYLSSGPTSHKLDFRHNSRSSHEMIDELGRTILNLCKVIPSGFVVFLPSYNYESAIFQRWRSTDMLAQINKKKPIHREPKSSRDLDAALSRYSLEASSSKTGALLFSVMGGKMSEGINFADDMARAVFVVGLPYPDITDPVLVEKMQSLDREYQRLGTGITGQSYYQNLCMRCVNQSVGRAIRHANDYAAIILADFRYTSDSRIWKGLPAWLRSEVPDPSISTFGKVMKNVRDFFAEK